MRTTKVERILLAALLLPVLAQAQDPIGRVLVSKGQASARAVDGTLRPLARRDQIFEQETLLTGADSFLQVRMVDDAQLSLGQGTEFKFERYRFDANPATPDAAVMTLVLGCFRSVSGSIGSGAGDEHHIDTAIASINIRGTFHEAEYDGSALYTGTQEGGTTVTNPQGSLDIGFAGNYDYSRTLQGGAPEGLIDPPVQLTNDNDCADSAGINTSPMDRVLTPAPDSDSAP